MASHGGAGGAPLDYDDLAAELHAAYDEIVRLRESATEGGVMALIQRAEVAEQRARGLEDDAEGLRAELERAKHRGEALEDDAVRLDREARELARARDEAETTLAKVRRDLDRTTDELHRCAAHVWGCRSARFAAS
jgi:septal ring factor EnvC (AmiA/AmiB activator)